jgi:UDP-GlcNAc:undecaprenyl-phosphate/decaprenyl-phosphate GlcNAc-1-phosphate transferase
MILSAGYTALMAGLVAMLVTLIALPRIIRFAIRCGVFDKPSERKLHEKPIPMLGGTAVFTGIIAAVFVCFPFLPQPPTLRTEEVYGVLGISLGAALCFIVGLFDDLFGLSPGRKFSLQVLIALAGVLFGIKIGFFSGLSTQYIFLPRTLTVILTVFWITALMNAVNLIDGLDGLATGISAIAASAFLVLGLYQHQYAVSLLSAAVLGACIAFLRYNFYPAKVFLGDSGSLVLGYMLATISILGPFKTTTALTVVLPILILGLPLFDTSLSILRRTIAGRKIYEADTEHVHYQLQRRGLSHRNTVLTLYGVSIILAVIAVLIGIRKGG